jgi:hypothetical protein
VGWDADCFAERLKSHPSGQNEAEEERLNCLCPQDPFLNNKLLMDPAVIIDIHN